MFFVFLLTCTVQGLQKVLEKGQEKHHSDANVE